MTLSGGAGSKSVFVIADDGELYTWGVPPNTIPLAEPTAYPLVRPVRVPKPDGVQRWREVMAGPDLMVAIVNDGQVLMWGRKIPTYSVISHGIPNYMPEAPLFPDLPEGTAAAEHVFLGETDCHVVTVSGELYSWPMAFQWAGMGSQYRPLGEAAHIPFPEGSGRCLKVVGGNLNTMALTEDGNLHAVGNNSELELGIGEVYGTTDWISVAKPEGVSRWSDVVRSPSHFLALTDDGRLYSWGKNVSGQLGLGDDGPFDGLVPRRVDGAGTHTWRTIAAFGLAPAYGQAMSFAVDDEGRVFSWGAASFRYDQSVINWNGGWNFSWGEHWFSRPGFYQRVNTPRPFSPLNSRLDAESARVVSLSGGDGFVVALLDDGRVLSWGQGASDCLGRPRLSDAHVWNPNPVCGFGLDFTWTHPGVGGVPATDAPLIVRDDRESGTPVSLSVDDPQGEVSYLEFVLRRADESAAPTYSGPVQSDSQRWTSPYEYTHAFPNLPAGAYEVDGRAVLGTQGQLNYPSERLVPIGPRRLIVLESGGTAVSEQLVSAATFDASVREGGADSATIFVVRHAPWESIAQELTVGLDWGGDARNGVDFMAPESVSFAPGETVIKIPITPIVDGGFEPTETLTLSIRSGEATVSGPDPQVSIDIINDAAPSPFVANLASGQTIPSGPFEVKFGARDDVSVEYLLLLLDGEPVVLHPAGGTGDVQASWLWQSPTLGSHELRVVASDNLGAIAYSDPLQVTVAATLPPVYRAGLSAGPGRAFLQTSDGRWFGWGDDYYHQLNGSFEETAGHPYFMLPVSLMPPPDGTRWTRLIPAEEHVFAISDSGHLWIFGLRNRLRLNGEGPIDLSDASRSPMPAGVTAWIDATEESGALYLLGNDHRRYRLGLIINVGTGEADIRFTQEELPWAVWIPEAAEQPITGWLRADKSIDTDHRAYAHGRAADIQGNRPVTVASVDSAGFILDGAGNLWSYIPHEQTWRPAPNPDGVGGWTALAKGNQHLLALSANGRLFSLGSNQRGQLGLGDWMNRTELAEVMLPESGAHWVSIAAGGDHSLALSSSGRVYSWGTNDRGQLGLGHITTEWLPRPIGWFGSLNDEAAEYPVAGFGNGAPFGELSVGGSAGYVPHTIHLEMYVRDPEWDPVAVEFFMDNQSLGVFTPDPTTFRVHFAVDVATGGAWTFHARISDDYGNVFETPRVAHEFLNKDTDLPRIYILPSELNVREGANDGVALRFSRDTHTNLSLTVPLAVSGTASAGTDYQPLPDHITFAPGQREVVLPIVTYRDDLNEAEETIVVSVPKSGCGPGGLASNGCYLANAYTQSTVRIGPPPRPIIAVDSPVPDISAVEWSNDTALFRFTRTGVVDRPVNVSYHVIGTVDPATDLVDFPRTLEFAVGQTVLEVVVTARNDYENEGVEHMLLVLDPGNCDDEESSGCYDRGYFAGTIYVRDNPEAAPALIRVVATDPVAIEGGTNTATLTISREGGRSDALDIEFLLGGDATLGVDYSMTPGAIHLEAGQTWTNVAIHAFADDVKEGHEYIEFVFPDPGCQTSQDPVGCYQITGTNLVRVFLLDPPVLPPIPGLADEPPGKPMLGMLFESLTPGVDGAVVLEVVSDPGVEFELQSSADLVQWNTEGTHLSVNGRLRVNCQPEQVAPCFFRVVPALRSQ